MGLLGLPVDVPFSLIVLALIVFSAGVRVINQYERAVKFRLGKYVGELQPGFRWIVPFIERVEKVDVRVVTMDVPSQEVMTQDNVPTRVNGVVFFRVVKAPDAVLEVEHYKFAVSQLAQTALRDMIGKADLDTVLSKREEIGRKVQETVDKETDPWGIKITDVKIKDIELPENMRRAMAHQAEAERDKRARLILADAEQQAAKKLQEAGKMLQDSPAALQLRLYQTLSDIAAEKNSTIVLPFPVEMMELVKKVVKK